MTTVDLWGNPAPEPVPAAVPGRARPKRIQMTRTEPWREANPHAAIIDRRYRWGNPYRVVPVHKSGPFDVWREGDFIAQTTGRESAHRIAVTRFVRALILGWYQLPTPTDIRHHLAGRDLACWCPLDLPCHGDVLLEIANGVADPYTRETAAAAALSELESLTPTPERDNR